MKKITKKNIFVLLFLIIAIFVFISFYFINIYEQTETELVDFFVADIVLKPAQRIFCLIISSEKTLNNQARAINQTWANECDKYFFITRLYKNSSSFELNDPLPILQPRTVSKNITSQTEELFWTYKYISKKYPDYDWYLKTDDRAFFFMQNLRQYLSMNDPSNLINCARNWTNLVKKGYRSSIASFLLSKQAMKSLGKHLIKNKDICRKTGVEYLDTAFCLNKLKVKTSKTHDLDRKELFFENNFIEEYQRRGFKKFSKSAISFHFTNDDEIYRLYFWYNYFKLKNETINVHSIIQLYVKNNWQDMPRIE